MDFDGLALVVGAGMNNSSLLNFESATKSVQLSLYVS